MKEHKERERQNGENVVRKFMSTSIESQIFPVEKNAPHCRR